MFSRSMQILFLKSITTPHYKNDRRRPQAVRRLLLQAARPFRVDTRLVLRLRVIYQSRSLLQQASRLSNIRSVRQYSS